MQQEFIAPISAEAAAVPWPILDVEDHAAVNAVLARGVLYRGPEVPALEREWSAFTGARHVIAASSCTHAIQLALAAIGVGPGDEVIVPAYTFIGTALPVLHLGAKPVFVDVDDQTGLPTATGIRGVVTHNTRAILPVHLHGLSVNVPSIREALGSERIAIIEDACQAHGTQLNGRHVGTFGEMGCFSLNSVKNLPAGQGGLVCTDDDTIAGRVRGLALHGIEREGLIIEAGFSFGLTELAAAIARVQLSKLPDRIAQVQRNASIISDALGDVSSVKPPAVPDGCQPSWHKYMVQLNLRQNRMSGQSHAQLRDQVLAALRRVGVPVEIWQRFPLPAHPLFGAHPESAFPAATHLLNCSFMVGTEKYPLIAQPESTICAWAQSLRDVLLRLEPVMDAVAGLCPEGATG